MKNIKKTFTIIKNEKIARATYEMKLSGDVSDITRPGQFVAIRLDGFFLRRPISVCDIDDVSDGGSGILTLIYKTVGGGTEYMSTLRPGVELNILTGLGNGYDTKKSGPSPLLIGGGCGVPPLYLLARRLIAEGKHVSVILGFGIADEVFYEDKFREIGASVIVTTADGSYGIRGFATDALPHTGLYTYTYSCGPEPMLRAVYKAAATSGQYSFEERMACGFGVCMGCSCRTVTGYKRICKDGPVLEKEEILWK